MLLKKNYFLIMLTIFGLSASAFAVDQSFILRCPMGSDLAKKLGQAQEEFSSNMSEIFTISMSLDYDPVRDKYEIFSGNFITTPVATNSPLTVTLENNPKIATYYYANGAYSLVSCRYKVVKAIPGYASSGSYSKLVGQGLTSATDGYFNLEGTVSGLECYTNQYFGSNGVICRSIAK